MTLAEQTQSFPQIRGQVARILLEHATDGTNGHKPLAQRDIATMLGTGWDMVHLSLKSLYNEGVIKIERNRIIINKDLIQKVAAVA
ncbi:MAG: helix-turn-helix domain-containing protein [Dehalococcoidales bacterium]